TKGWRESRSAMEAESGSSRSKQSRKPLAFLTQQLQIQICFPKDSSHLGREPPSVAHAALCQPLTIGLLPVSAPSLRVSTAATGRPLCWHVAGQGFASESSHWAPAPICR